MKTSQFKKINDELYHEITSDEILEWKKEPISLVIDLFDIELENYLSVEDNYWKIKLQSYCHDRAISAHGFFKGLCLQTLGKKNKVEETTVNLYPMSRANRLTYWEICNKKYPQGHLSYSDTSPGSKIFLYIADNVFNLIWDNIFSKQLSKLNLQITINAFSEFYDDGDTILLEKDSKNEIFLTNVVFFQKVTLASRNNLTL